MNASRLRGLLLGASPLALGLLTLWLAAQPTPRAVMILTLVLGPAAIGLAAWALGRRNVRNPPLEPYAPEMDGVWRRRAGPGRAPMVLALMVLPLIALWTTWMLAHAAMRGEIYIGHDHWATVRGDPLGFWTHVVLDGLGALILYGMGGLALYLRKGRTRRIDAYLGKRADEGSLASAIPPRLR